MLQQCLFEGTVLITEAKQALACQGTHLPMFEVDDSHRGGLGIGYVKMASCQGQSAWLAEGGLFQRAVVDALATASGPGSDLANGQIQPPDLVGSRHGDV